MNIVLWILQVFLGIYFLYVGAIHFALPPYLPGPLSWMYELSPGLHYLSGTAEILGGLGLILPGLTRIQTRLTPLAAAGLALVMISALIWHIQRGEVLSIFLTLVLAILTGFVAYGRWRLSPFQDQSSLSRT